MLRSILNARHGRTMIETALALGLTGILSASLLSYLACFFRSEMSLSSRWVNHSLLRAATSFIEDRAREKTLAGGELVWATPAGFRIELPRNKPRVQGYVEVRYESAGITVKTRDSGPERTIRPVPADIVVSTFAVEYKDEVGRVLQFPFDVSQVRSLTFYMDAYEGREPSNVLKSSGTVGIPAGGQR